MHRVFKYPVQIVITGNLGDTFCLAAAQTQGSWVTPFGTWYVQGVVFDSVSSITNLETITLRALPE
jgi:membrane protein implicated in regulation of membrane protease activity